MSIKPGMMRCPECGQLTCSGLGYRVHKVACEAQPNFARIVHQTYLSVSELEDAIRDIIEVESIKPVSDGFYVRHANGNLTKVVTTSIVGPITVQNTI